ncbi:MAG: N-acetyl-gamma-glutamyl-phosphate reductase [Gemmatimonadales bacterium]|nr:MAG: N-acetyl-gamma-glutamyl-phosphate reductase [Gemmatimonadales bacterium]
MKLPSSSPRPGAAAPSGNAPLSEAQPRANPSSASAPSPRVPVTTSPGGRVTAGVLGGSGYTGREVTRLLDGHAGVDLVFTTSRSEAGNPSSARTLAFSQPDEGAVLEVDVVFLCLPHGEAAAWADRIVGHGPRVIDLTADHRPGSGREDGAVYGLNEWNREAVADAQLVANPGCYPTGVLLSLLPLHEAGILDPDRLIVVNASSGVTGAGRVPRADLLFAEVSGDFRAYAWGNRHRHLLEMRALLPGVDLLFQPHLLPVPRGILETMVLPVRDGVDAGEVRRIWASRYEFEPAVLPLEDRLPALSDVVGTDGLALGVTDVADTREPAVMAGAALDNLGKGAAGQAVQNMNAIFGWPTERGIRCP